MCNIVVDYKGINRLGFCHGKNTQVLMECTQAVLYPVMEVADIFDLCNSLC